MSYHVHLYSISWYRINFYYIKDTRVSATIFHCHVPSSIKVPLTRVTECPMTCTIPIDYNTFYLWQLEHTTVLRVQMPHSTVHVHGFTCGIDGIPPMELGIPMPSLGFRHLRHRPARQRYWPSCTSCCSLLIPR